MDHPHHPRTRRMAATAGLGAALALTLAACGGADGSDTAQRPDPGKEAANELNKAQLVQYGEAKIVPERSEKGTYSRLATTRQSEKLRESAKVDEPGCMDATTKWGRIPEVRDAAASLATFARGDDTITHMLLEVPEGTAREAVEAEPPNRCERYTATMADGTTSTYTVRDIDLPTIADDSRAFAVTSEFKDQRVEMYNVVYRNGDHLGATSVLGGNTKDDYRDLLAGFTRKALEREKKILG